MLTYNEIFYLIPSLRMNSSPIYASLRGYRNHSHKDIQFLWQRGSLAALLLPMYTCLIYKPKNAFVSFGLCPTALMFAIVVHQ